MRDLLYEPGTASVRAQIGIEADDARVFHPYRIDEISRCSAIMRRDEEIPEAVRELLSVGLIYDMRPAHLSPSVSVVSRHIRISIQTVRRRRIDWESVDPEIRFDLVARATRLILIWRGSMVR